MNTFYNNIGTRIRKLREINHWTREEFSEMTSISPKFLYEIETGRKGFSAETLYHIAKALSVNCEYILNGNDGKHPAANNHGFSDLLNLFDETQMDMVSQVLVSMYQISSNK